MFSRMKTAHNATEWFLGIMALAMMGLILLMPLLKILFDMFHECVESGAIKGLFSIRQGTLLLKTLIFSSGSVLISGTIGYLTAIYLWQDNSRGQKAAKSFFWSLIFIPAYVHGLAWIKGLAWLNRGLRGVGWPVLSTRGMGISVVVQTFALLPLCFTLAYVTLMAIEKQRIEAAHFFGGTKILSRIIVPMTWPNYGMGLLVIWIVTLFDYTIPSLFSMNVYAMEIFLEFSSSYNPSRAFLLSLPLMLLSSLAIYGIGRRKIKWKIDFNSLHTYGIAELKTSATMMFFQKSAYAIMLGGSLFLVMALLSSLFKTSQFDTTLEGFTGDLITTLQVVLGVLLVSSIINVGASFALESKLRLKPMLWGLLVLPFVIPSPVIGIALIETWNHPLFQMLYRSLWMPVMGLSARFWSVGVLITYGYIVHWNREPIEMAQICEKSSLRNMLYVKLPLAMRGILISMMVVGMLSFHEIGASILLLPPGKSTVSLRVYNYLHYGASDEVMIICLGISLGIAFMTRVCLRLIRFKDRSLLKAFSMTGGNSDD